jgi:hypothetical protein
MWSFREVARDLLHAEGCPTPEMSTRLSSVSIMVYLPIAAIVDRRFEPKRFSK